MRVIVAPDSFKGSVDAATAAEAIGSGWRAVRPFDDVVLMPQADGGEGTLDAIGAAVAGSRLHDSGPVHGPDGRPVEGHWLELPDGVAVVELAQSSGLPLMARLDPLGATTRGLGDVIAAALDAGALALIIGLGGSASTDGGTGALRALGLELRDAEGGALPDGGGALTRLADVDVGQLRLPPVGGVRLLTDVTAPLLGPAGAAAVFGGQKGAGLAEIAQLDAGLARWASVLGRADLAAVPGAGAAGGTGYGFLAAWSAGIESGAAAIAALTGLAAAAASADLVITGEGRFDATSASGKVVGNVLELADAHNIGAAVIAGSLSAVPVTPEGREVWALGLVELAGTLGSALDDPTRWLYAAGMRAARTIASATAE